jgi:hypothetical protein
MSDLNFLESLNQATKTVNLYPEYINPIVRCHHISKSYVLQEAESERMAGKLLNLNGLFLPGGELPLELFRHSKYNGKPEKWKTWEEVKSQAQLTSPRSRTPQRDSNESSSSPRARREEDTYESSMRSSSRVLDEGNYEFSRRSRSHRDDDNNESPRRVRYGPRRVDENDKASRKNEVSGRRDEKTNETRSPSSSEFSNQSKINRQLLVRNNKLNTLVRQDLQKGLDREEAKAGFFSREEWWRETTTARCGQLTYSQLPKLFVGNIKANVRTDDLLHFLGRAIIQARLSLYAGSLIRKCKLFYAPNEVKQYAFLEVRTEEEAQKLLHLNLIPVVGHTLIVHRRGNKGSNCFSWQALEIS